MTLLILGNAVVWNGSKVKKAIDVVDQAEKLITNYPNLVIHQNIWSFEINFLSISEKLLANINLICGSRKIPVTDSLPADQDYILQGNEFLPLCERSIKALTQIEFRAVKDLTNLTIFEFTFLEQLFIDLELKVNRSDTLQVFLGRTNLAHQDFILDLNVEPWPYQKIGIEWLLSRYHLGTSGALLADFMGLGKTLQYIGVISHLASKSKANRLVIVPNHLVMTLTNEIRKFAPNLSVLIHRGAKRYGVSRLLRDYDLVLTTYPTLIKDFYILSDIDWDIVISDEAQAIKNRNSRSSVCIKGINRKFSVAVTGTPLETNLSEYWSLMEFITPKTIDDWPEFQNRIERFGFNPTDLHHETAHLKLRRNLEDVGSQLPPVIPVPHVLEWPEQLDGLYEDVRLEALREFPKSGGFQASLRLRQLTTHPYLLGFRNENLISISPKFQTLVDLIDEIFANGERALVFTAFNEMNDLIVDFFKTKYPNYIVASLYGETSEEERHRLVEEINQEVLPGILICNVIVAGTGLNIQGANHVIHYNLEWNPAKEDQASYRVIRPGQQRNVFIHRFMYANTIDEIIDERLQMRRQLAAQVVEGVITPYDYLAGLEVSPGNFRK
jgi:SNF2 family DNA or RNA helicase